MTASPGPLVAQVPKLRGSTVTDLTMDDSGDYRATLTVDMGTMHYVGDFGYDELRHELRTASQSADDGVIILRPAWYTDFQNIDVFYLSFQADANTVRALLAAADPQHAGHRDDLPGASRLAGDVRRRLPHGQGDGRGGQGDRLAAGGGQVVAHGRRRTS